MLTSALISDVRQLSRDVALFLRDSSDRGFVSDVLHALGGCNGSIAEVSTHNSADVNCRLLNYALRSLRRADSLIEIGTDGGLIPESHGNRWLRRCRTIIPRLARAYKDSRRTAGLSFRLPEPTVLFTTQRLTVRGFGEGDLSFLVSLLGEPDCRLDGITSPEDRDTARRLVRGGTASVITRGDGERVGAIFCTSDENVEGMRWLRLAVSPEQRGRGYFIEAVEGFTDYALRHGAAALGISLPPSKRFLAKSLERYGYTASALCGRTVLTASEQRNL